MEIRREGTGAKEASFPAKGSSKAARRDHAERPSPHQLSGVQDDRLRRIRCGRDVARGSTRMSYLLVALALV